MKKAAKSSIRGSVYLAFIAATAMMAVVGVLSTNLVISLLGSSQTVSAQTETTAKMNTIADAIAKAASDADDDGIYEVSISAGFNTNPAVAAGGGVVPGDKVGISTDGWRQPFKYCAWDFGPNPTRGFATSYDGITNSITDTPMTEVLFALISGGANKQVETTCNQAKLNQAQSDDVVRAVTLAEVQSARGTGIEKCVDSDGNELENYYNAFNPATGKFECKSLAVTSDTLQESGNCNPGEVFNGRVCTKPLAPDAKFSPAVSSMLFLSRIVTTPGSLEQTQPYPYTGYAAKGGVLATVNDFADIDTSGATDPTSRRRIILWYLNDKDGSWMPGPMLNFPDSGQLGRDLKIITNKGSKYEGNPILVLPEAFYVHNNTYGPFGPESPGNPGKIHFINLGNKVYQGLGSATTAKDHGFIDYISAARQSGPINMTTFKQKYFEDFATVTLPITTAYEPTRVEVAECSTPTTLLNIMAVSDVRYDNKKGRIYIYEQTEANNKQFQLVKTLDAPRGIQEGAFGTTIGLSCDWLVSKSMPRKNNSASIKTGVQYAGENYIYRRTPGVGSNAYGTWGQQSNCTGVNAINCPFQILAPQHGFADYASANNYVDAYTLSLFLHAYDSLDSANLDSTRFMYLHNIAIDGNWLAIGEPNSRRASEAKAGGTVWNVPQTGLIAMYQYNGTQWVLSKNIESPYRGTTIDDTDYNPDSNGIYTPLDLVHAPLDHSFGSSLDMKNGLLLAFDNNTGSQPLERFTSVSPASPALQFCSGDCLPHFYRGMLQLWKLQGSNWVPKDIFAKHYEPVKVNTPGTTTYSKNVAGTFVRLYLVGDGIKLDENGYVFAKMAWDTWENPTFFGSSPPAASIYGVYNNLIFGPYKDGQPLFVDDATDKRETCPNKNHPYFSGPDANNLTFNATSGTSYSDAELSSMFGLTKSTNCFADYDYVNQRWNNP